MTTQSDKVRIGAGYAWFRPIINSGLKVTLGSRYSGDTTPDPIFDETDFCWSLSGTFLGQTQGIDITPTFQDNEIGQDFINAPTDDYLENQSLDISLKLAYNGVTSITDLFELPEVNVGASNFGGLNLTPYKGSLLILESNVRNNSLNTKHLVRCRLYYNVRVIPGKISITGGHTFVDAKFRVLAAIDPLTGCYRPYTYHRWTTSIYSPNTEYMPNGNTVNTDIDVPYPFAGGVLMNL